MLMARCFFLLLLGMVAGCTGRNLYHYHRTVIGVDISGNVAGDTPSGHLTLGYSRRLVIFMPPEIQEALQEKSPTGNIPPTVFCTQVKASLGGVNAFREIIATGEPADSYAQQLVASMIAAPAATNRNFVCPGLVIPEADRAVAGKQSMNPPQPLAK